MKILLYSLAGALALLATFAGILFLWPRPPDTTDPRVFAGDAGAVDRVRHR